MSLADDAKLLLIPTGYKTSKVYSVFPTDGDGDFDYTRSGDASRVNPGGLIETVGTNIPRIDHFGGGCPTLNLEPQRTNLILYSEQFSGTNWGSVNTTITANQTISPDGTLNADKLQRTSTSASFRPHNISKSASAITYTTSVFLKKGSDNYFAMRAQGSYPSRADFRFRFDTEEIYSTQAFSNFTILDYGVQNYSNGWYRMHFTYTSDSHTNLSITFSPRATNGNIDSSDTSSTSFAYVWGAQTEVGSYVSSYIKTEASTVTRLKDECINGGDADLFDITEGTFFVDITPFNNESSNRYISLSDSTSDNRIEFQIRASANVIDVLCEGNNGGLEVIRTISVTFNTRNKLLVTFNDTNFKIYINGSLNFTDTSFTKPINLNRLSFANSTNGFVYEGKVHDTRVYDRVLTESEAIELTTL